MTSLIEKTKEAFSDLRAWSERREQVKAFDRAVEGGESTIRYMVERPYLSDTWASQRANFIVDTSYDDATTAQAVGRLANEIKDETGSERGMGNKIAFLHTVARRGTDLPLTVRSAQLGMLQEVNELTEASHYRTAVEIADIALNAHSLDTEGRHKPDSVVNDTAKEVIGSLAFGIMNRGEHSRAGIIEQSFGDVSQPYKFKVETALHDRHEMLGNLLKNASGYPDVQRAVLPYAQAIVDVARDQFGYTDMAASMEKDVYFSLSHEVRDELKAKKSGKDAAAPQVA
jgi:hypothetical protein